MRLLSTKAIGNCFFFLFRCLHPYGSSSCFFSHSLFRSLILFIFFGKNLLWILFVCVCAIQVKSDQGFEYYSIHMCIPYSFSIFFFIIIILFSFLLALKFLHYLPVEFSFNSRMDGVYFLIYSIDYFVS